MSATIAQYGVADDAGRGRAHAEPFPAAVPPFEFDRRRVQASAAFRRLQYKTQVFVSPQGDHYRTRLTHTLEVAAVARHLAMSLGVNAVLAEVSALTHDLGHPPFGHAGEQALNRLMSEHGGFEHNAQSLRVVDYLEHPFPPFRGLNLTAEVREALLKHRTRFDDPQVADVDDAMLRELLQRGPQPSVEGQIVSLADRLAYNCHDLEDALGADLLAARDLAEVRLWRQAAQRVQAVYTGDSIFAIWRPLLEQLQQHLLDDAVVATRRALREQDVRSPDQARALPEPVVCFSPETERAMVELEEFLFQRVYRHPRLRELDQRAAQVITELFAVYVRQPERLPPRFAERVPEQGGRQVACDYIAGMTDRFCEAEFRHIFLPFSDRP